jgi:predicted O-linked N-acetylglucosamine transferase (SPINDLY family)
MQKNKPNKKIRIGYYSADYYEHATSYLIAELIELHDKSKFEIFGFSFGPDKDDKMRKRISKAFDQFIDVNLKSDKEVAQLSRDLKIDIAVDLKGFTQFSRFGIFVERCAPIQVNYLGHPGTLGADCIDYIIADKVLIPQKNQKDYSEKIIYLPHCYQVNDSNKKISDKVFTKKELGLPEDGFVFCCFNQSYKITPYVFDIWMRLMKRIDGSILWLIKDSDIGVNNLKKEAQKRGVEPDRIIFADKMSNDEHLARHRLADLFIDTFPYTAHTTCSDALWSSLPVVTRIGQSFASRVSASLLTAIGLSELITKTEKEYEELTFKIANNKSLLNEIKKKLTKNKPIKSLFNTKLFTKNIESAFVIMHERYHSNILVKNIEIK